MSLKNLSDVVFSKIIHSIECNDQLKQLEIQSEGPRKFKGADVLTLIFKGIKFNIVYDDDRLGLKFIESLEDIQEQYFEFWMFDEVFQNIQQLIFRLCNLLLTDDLSLYVGNLKPNDAYLHLVDESLFPLITNKEIRLQLSRQFICRVRSMTSAERDCLRKAFEKGPLDDGDIPSKTGRDLLVHEGFMTQVIVAREQGFNACTYKGANAYKLLDAGL